MKITLSSRVTSLGARALGLRVHADIVGTKVLVVVEVEVVVLIVPIAESLKIIVSVTFESLIDAIMDSVDKNYVPIFNYLGNDLNPNLFPHNSMCKGGFVPGH